MSVDLKEALVRHYITGDSVIGWARGYVNAQKDAAPEIARIAGLPPEEEEEAASSLARHLQGEHPHFVPHTQEWCELARTIFLAECKSFVKGATTADHYAKVVLSMEDLCRLPSWLQDLSEVCSTVLLAPLNPYGINEEEVGEMKDFMREEAERCLLAFGLRTETS